MKSTLKRAASLALTGAMAVSLAACGGSASSTDSTSTAASTGGSTSTPAETTLKIYMFGQAEGFDAIQQKFEEETKDTLNIKLDIVWSDVKTHREKIPLMMALGTGNKLDPSQLRLADISETYGCPLARVMRKELRNRGICRQPVVFSPEQPAPTTQRETPPPGRRSVPASNPWVPAVAGLLIGSKVVRDLIANKGV